MTEKTFFQKIKDFSFYGLFFKFTKPISPGLYFVNFFFQRILRINSNYNWMIHFTNKVIGEIVIGENVNVSFAVSGGCYFQGNNKIYIGDNTIFAPNVVVVSSNHSFDNLSKWEDCDPIRIGKNCWIGANVVILPTVELGDNVIVGAGAIVTKSFTENNIVLAGNPAKIIKRL